MFRNRGKQNGKSVEDIAAKILEEVYKREQDQNENDINDFQVFN